MSYSHVVYRAFADDGTLLYVGCTQDLYSRLGQHRTRATWFREMACLTVEHFDSRPVAREAEARAIGTEKPIHNQANVHTAQAAQRAAAPLRDPDDAELIRTAIEATLTAHDALSRVSWATRTGQVHKAWRALQDMPFKLAWAMDRIEPEKEAA